MRGAVRIASPGSPERRDLGRDLVLQAKTSPALVMVAGPKDPTVHVDEPRADADAVAVSTNAAFDLVADRNVRAISLGLVDLPLYRGTAFPTSRSIPEIAHRVDDVLRRPSTKYRGSHPAWFTWEDGIGSGAGFAERARPVGLFNEGGVLRPYRSRTKPRPLQERGCRRAPPACRAQWSVTLGGGARTRPERAQFGFALWCRRHRDSDSNR